jgi:hypothetical protein
MTTLIVLFNLKPGADVQAYEKWAKTTDLPIVRKLPSIASFNVYRSAGLLGGDGQAPYQYVEVLDVTDMQQFGSDVGTDVMAKVAGEFREFADSPAFMLTSSIEQEG